MLVNQHDRLLPVSCRLIGRALGFCEGVVEPKGGRERTQGYQLRLETAPVLPYRFFIIGVEL